jgi:hypothetical protein
MNGVLFTGRKLSHDFDRTEIERFSNCHSFRSFSDFSVPARRQGKSFDALLIDPARRFDENMPMSHDKAQAIRREIAK